MQHNIRNKFCSFRIGLTVFVIQVQTDSISSRLLPPVSREKKLEMQADNFGWKSDSISLEFGNWLQHKIFVIANLLVEYIYWTWIFFVKCRVQGTLYSLKEVKSVFELTFYCNLLRVKSGWCAHIFMGPRYPW